jgi:polyisoprenoid-binding protein YceI
MRWNLIKFATLTVLVFAKAAQGSFTVDSAKSSVEFLALGKPKMIQIQGKKAKTSGAFDLKSGGEISVDLDSLETGIALRDRHMKEKYLETGKGANYRNAVFKIKKISLPGSGLPKSGTIQSKVEGTMTIHGVDKDLQIPMNINVEGASAEFSGKTNLLLADFKIGVPSFAGVTVAETVELSFKIFALAKHSK